MTPQEMLAPQPAPYGEGLSVTDIVLDGTAMTLPPLVAGLLRERRVQGTERYGTELRTGNGRDPKVDALQEAVDLLVYLWQDHIEATLGTEHWFTVPRRIYAVTALVSELAHDLARRDA